MLDLGSILLSRIMHLLLSFLLGSSATFFEQETTFFSRVFMMIDNVNEGFFVAQNHHMKKY